MVRNILVPFAVCSVFLVLSACSSDEVGDDVDTGGRDTGSGGDAVDVDGTDTGDDESTSDVPVDAAETSDGSGGDTGGEVVEGGCASDDDCTARYGCLEGVCVERCASAVDCGDGNVCSEDLCTDGFCTYTAIEPEIADAITGDCRRFACVEGRLAEVDFEDDVPEDDGIFCTVEECSGRFPRITPDHERCDDGDDSNGFERCSAEDGGCITGDDPPWVCAEFDPAWLLTEECDNGQDDNNNGEVDEGCPCAFGTVQRCFLGAPGARNVGGCLDGTQQCVDRDDPRWGECEGGILPGEEVCDGKDNDCDGCVDDIPDCAPLLTCPVEDEARPLRYYPLDATTIFGGSGTDWEWRIIAPPNSATRGAESPTSPRTQVYLDVSGDYQVSLTVRDDKGDLLGCSWIVRVSGAGLRVEMRWDTFGRVDMDLHLGRGSGPFCGANDCYYANCRVYGSVPWGYAPSPVDACEVELGASSCPNPRLDIDNISGFDPENINLDNPNNGDTFRVMAHKFSGSALTNPVISLYCGGRLRGVFGEAPDLAGLTSAGGGCQGNTWRVADVTMLVDAATGATDCEFTVLTSDSGGWDIRNNTAAY